MKREYIVFIGFGITMLACSLVFFFMIKENEIGIWLSGGVAYVVTALTMIYGDGEDE